MKSLTILLAMICTLMYAYIVGIEKRCDAKIKKITREKDSIIFYREKDISYLWLQNLARRDMIRIQKQEIENLSK